MHLLGDIDETNLLVKNVDILQVDILVPIQIEACAGRGTQPAVRPGHTGLQITVIQEVDPAVLVAVEGDLPEPETTFEGESANATQSTGIRLADGTG